MTEPWAGASMTPIGRKYVIVPGTVTLTFEDADVAKIGLDPEKWTVEFNRSVSAAFGTMTFNRTMGREEVTNRIFHAFAEEMFLAARAQSVHPGLTQCETCLCWFANVIAHRVIEHPHAEEPLHPDERPYPKTVSAGAGHAEQWDGVNRW